MKRHFSKHVKVMHEKRDCGFEKEFQVCLACHMNPLNSTKYNSFESYPRKSSFCRPLQLFLMVLWILPRLTQQRTDTTIFTPVSQRMLKHITHIMWTLSWHVLSFSLVLRTCMVFDLPTCIWAMIGTHVNLNVLMILVIHKDHYTYTTYTYLYILY